MMAPEAGAVCGVLFGYNVAVTGEGLLFAVARGTSAVLLRLPATVVPEAIRTGAECPSNLSEDGWVQFNPWREQNAENNGIATWISQAYEYAARRLT
jgi:hypothetical protein